jgi:hypothetical protein
MENFSLKEAILKIGQLTKLNEALFTKKISAVHSKQPSLSSGPILSNSMGGYNITSTSAVPNVKKIFATNVMTGASLSPNLLKYIVTSIGRVLLSKFRLINYFFRELLNPITVYTRV